MADLLQMDAPPSQVGAPTLWTILRLRLCCFATAPLRSAPLCSALLRTTALVLTRLLSAAQVQPAPSHHSTTPSEGSGPQAPVLVAAPSSDDPFAVRPLPPGSCLPAAPPLAGLSASRPLQPYGQA